MWQLIRFSLLSPIRNCSLLTLSSLRLFLTPLSTPFSFLLHLPEILSLLSHFAFFKLFSYNSFPWLHLSFSLVTAFSPILVG